MVKEDFVSNITLKWRIGPRAEKSEERNKLFFDDLYTFGSACPENHLQDVYNYITRAFKSTGYKPVPDISLFYTYAEESGYIPTRNKPKKKRNPYWCCCKDCGKEYGFRGRGCPVCGSVKYYVYASETSIPGHVELVQEDCSICNEYEKRNTDGNYIFGPECNSFGLGTKPFDNCKDCGCKVCCHQYFCLLKDSRKFKLELMSGQWKMPWIPGISRAEIKKQKKVNR